MNTPQKICHFIWQLISGQVAVTRNLVRRNMQCDNYCPRCEEPEEIVTHAILPTGLTNMGIIINTVKLSKFPHLEYLRQHGLSILEEE